MVTPSLDDKTRGTGGNGGGGGTAVCVVDVAVAAQVSESNASGPNTRIVVLTVDAAPVVEVSASFVDLFGDDRSESRC
jgi:hypothetical protein